MDSWITNILEGREYFCDRHDSLGEKIPVSRLDYDTHVKYNDLNNTITRYCTPCWNYMKLRKWKCDCGASGSLRNEDTIKFITCICGKECQIR